MIKIIPQYFELFENLKAFNANDITDTSNFTFEPFSFRYPTIQVENLLNFQNLFILAEPGYGKSTLLEELKKHLDKSSITYQFIYGIDNKAFIINDNIEVLIFDALDENKDVVPTFLELLTITKDKNIKLIISNRIHYLNKVEHLIQNIDFKFIRLLPFNKGQIFEFFRNTLQEKNFDDETLNQVIENSKSSNGNSILSTPRYLNEFCKYILNNDLKTEDIKVIKKSELFEKVVFYKLEAENKGNKNKIFLTKRVLERLALIMEIHEINQITKEDFITFLDQANSNISLIFLNTVDLDDLLDRVMKTTGDFLQFEHSEFQEYLAAKELSRIGYRYQTIYDLMIDPILQYIKPNWIDVLSYAVDLDSAFVKPVIRFIETRNYESIDERLIEILININLDKEENSFLDHFFKVIFGFYSFKGKSIFQIYKPLSKYIRNDNEILKPRYKVEDIPDAATHIVSNQILLIEALANDKRLDVEQEEIWITYFTEVLKTNRFHSIHSVIFHAFMAFGNPEPLLQLIDDFEKREDYILNGILCPLGNMAPNDQRSINLINRCLKLRRRLDSLDSLINDVSDESGLISIFETLRDNINVLNNNHFHYSPGFYPLFENVKALNSPKLNKSIENFIIAIFKFEPYLYFKINIIDLSLKYTISSNPEFIKKLLSFKKFVYELDEIIEIIAKQIDLNLFKFIEEFLLKNEHGWRHQELVHKTKYALEEKKNSPIYEYINLKYLIPWEKERKPTVKAPIEKTVIDEYRNYFLTDHKLYNTGLIPFFISRHKELLPLLDSDDILYTHQVIDMIMNAYDIDKFSLEIIERGNNKTSFTHNHETWFNIDSYFKAAYLLRLTDLLLKYRKKFLLTLPSLDHYGENVDGFLPEIFNDIGSLTGDDIILIYDFCINRKDDLIVFNSRSFAEMAAKMNLFLLNPVLEKLFENDKIDSYDKEKILEALGELSSTQDDFKRLILIFKESKNPYKLKDIANFFLIKKFQDKNAINWRFKELERRLQPFDSDFRYNGTRGVSSFESEMDHPKFATCYYGIENHIIYEGMLELLQFSFDIRTNKLNFKYSNYLQSIVYNYFKAFLNEKVLNDIRRVLSKYHVPEHIYSFNQHLDKLITELYLQKKNQEPFISAIHSANRILSKSYLPIQSHLELKEFILSALNNEIKNLIENEGFYRVASDLSEGKKQVNESLIQKTLKIALGKVLLEKGLRKVDIFREVESLGGLRYDFLITYGLYGPIMVELKLMHNPEIQNTTNRNSYKKKLVKYLEANNAMGIYAVFQTKNELSHKHKFIKMVSSYKDIKGLDIISFECFETN